MTEKNKDFFSLDQLLFNCDCIKNYCHNNRCQATDELAIKCDQLLDSLQFIDQRAKELRFEDIPLNGFAQFIRIATSFTDRIANQIKIKNKLDTKFIELFDLIFTYRDWLKDTYETLKKENNNSLMGNEFSASSKAFYNTIHSNENALRLAFSFYVGFWLPRELRKLLHFFLFLMAFAYRLPYSVASLWSNTYLGKYCVSAFMHVNLDYCFNVWHLSECFFSAKVLNYFLNLNIPVNSKTLHLSRQTRFRLDTKGNILDLDNMTKDEIDRYLNDKIEQERLDAPGKRHRNRETIKCRYSYIKNKRKIAESSRRIADKKINKLSDFKALRHCSAFRIPEYSNFDKLNNNQNYVRSTSNNENFEIRITDEDAFLDGSMDFNEERTLMIVIHGGGLFTQGSTSAEIYLRKIVNELGGIPILAIDYSLTVPFPIPNQEILDVYLWALSGDEEVEQLIGFQPKQIVITGDSIGGFFCISLSIILNELNKLLKRRRNFKMNETIPLPKSIVAAYPAISMSNATPSKCLFTLEPLVEFRLFALMVSMYGGNMWSVGDFKKIENSELFKKIAAKNAQNSPGQNFENGITVLKNSDDSSPWFMVDYPSYKNCADYLSTFYNNPFITPASYGDKFEELKDISLFTFVGDQDFLLDDVQELCRLWRGKVHVDIMHDCIHAFLQFGHISETAKEALELVISRYQQACGLL